MANPEQSGPAPQFDSSSDVPMPAGMRFGYRFWFLNAINYQIASGTPVILFVKDLGASATVLGILASLLPLFAFLQLPAARFLPRFGYKKFMLGGWGLRVIMVFLLSGVPLLAFLDATTKVALVILLLVVFSILRGISVGAWLPWLTELLPPGKRATYLSREQVAVHSGSLFALGISAVTLQFLPNPVRYSAIFLLSAAAGAISLFALRKIPDVEPTESARSSSQAVPWATIIGYRPFQKLLLFNGLWATATSSLVIFTVSFSREILHLPDSIIVYLSLFMFLGALMSLPFTAQFLDRIGIKKTLRLTTTLAAAVTFGWLLLASGIVPGSFGAVAALNLVLGIATANFSVANASLAMGIMPVMGRNHFFALYTVVTSIVTALSPILFGIFLDAFRHFSGHAGAWSINRYSLYFLISLLVLAGAWLTVSILRENEIGTLNRRDFAILAGLRRFGRLWQR